MAAILLVVGDKANISAGDPVIRDRLINNHGHTITLVSDEDAEPASGTYDGFVISDSCSSATVGNKYGTVVKPGIWLEGGPLVGVGLCGSTQQLNSQSVWEIPAENVLTGGLVGDQTVYSSAQTQTFGLNLGAGVIVGATQNDIGTRFPYFAYEAGATMASGTAPARRVAFNLLNGTVSAFTTAGYTMLDAAITFAFPPPPAVDPPGFFLGYP